MSYVIATQSRNCNELLFMVDRAKQRAGFWSNRLEDALVYQHKAAAQAKVATLKFNRPHVMTLAEAQGIVRESEAERDHEDAMDASESGWDGHKGNF